MPSSRSSRSLSAKTVFALNALTTSELWKGYSYARTIRYSRKADQKPLYKERTISVKGSALYPSRIEALKMGARPTAHDNRELAKMYRRFQYHELRRVGASIKIAKEKSSASVNDARAAIQKFTQWAKKMSKVKGIDIEKIRASFARSEKEFEDFMDKYVRR